MGPSSVSSPTSETEACRGRFTFERATDASRSPLQPNCSALVFVRMDVRRYGATTPRTTQGPRCGMVTSRTIPRRPGRERHRGAAGSRRAAGLGCFDVRWRPRLVPATLLDEAIEELRMLATTSPSKRQSFRRSSIRQSRIDQRDGSALAMLGSRNSTCLNQRMTSGRKRRREPGRLLAVNDQRGPVRVRRSGLSDRVTTLPDRRQPCTLDSNDAQILRSQGASLDSPWTTSTTLPSRFAASTYRTTMNLMSEQQEWMSISAMISTPTRTRTAPPGYRRTSRRRGSSRLDRCWSAPLFPRPLDLAGHPTPTDCPLAPSGAVMRLLRTWRSSAHESVAEADAKRVRSGNVEADVTRLNRGRSADSALSVEMAKGRARRDPEVETCCVARAGFRYVGKEPSATGAPRDPPVRRGSRRWVESSS